MNRLLIAQVEHMQPPMIERTPSTPRHAQTSSHIEYSQTMKSIAEGNKKSEPSLKSPTYISAHMQRPTHMVLRNRVVRHSHQGRLCPVVPEEAQFLHRGLARQLFCAAPGSVCCRRYHLPSLADHR